MPKTIRLKRVITRPLLVCYGVGTILGAGIYSLIGKIVGISGIYAPFSFVVSALIATFVALSYAELTSRFPKSAGEAVYVDQAFGQRWLTGLIGWGIVLTGLVSAGVMARGFQGYLNEFIGLPESLAIILFIVLISAIAIAGVSLSFKFAATITFIEIAGIILLLVVTHEQLLTLTDRWQELLPPLSKEIWLAIFSGAFLAFYAYIGFEDMVNVAEEVIEPETTLPSAIIIALIISTLLYAMVALAAVLTLPVETLANHGAPFALIVRESSDIPAWVISLISLIAILNGAMIQIIMASRVLYGLAEKGLSPDVFSYIHPQTRTPVIATAFFSVILLPVTLWFPIENLAKITSLLILVIFILVTISLAIIKLRIKDSAQQSIFQLPVAIPIIGACLCLIFILVQLG